MEVINVKPDPIMHLNIVICTHNRSPLLKLTLDSLNQSKRPNNINLNILVIANACSDNTLSLLAEYQEQSCNNKNLLPVEYEAEPKIGKSNALNRAISSIDHGFICFVDDDHRVDKYFLCSIKDALQKYPDTRIFCGQIIPDWTGAEPQWVHDTGIHKIYPLPIPHFELGPHPTSIDRNSKIPGGGNLIVHSAIFDQLGGFSPDLGPKGHDLLGSEDSDFILRALDAGERILYVPGIVQYHFVDQERLRLNYLLKKSFQRSRSITLAHNPSAQSVPRYLWRKLFNYAIGIIFSLNISKIRFYLMRFSATLGEIIGTKESI